MVIKIVQSAPAIVMTTWMGAQGTARTAVDKSRGRGEGYTKGVGKSDRRVAADEMDVLHGRGSDPGRRAISTPKEILGDGAVIT